MTRLRTLIAGSTVAIGLTAAAAAQAETVEFMTWTYAEETGRPIMEQMIVGFDTATGNVVEPLGYAWGEMQRNLFLRSRSGTLPDVSQSQGRWLPIAGLLPGIVDFNEVYGADALAERFDPAFLSLGQLDGRQLGLPWIGGTVGMVANTAVLDEAGVADIPVTVDEFHAALEAVRDNVANSVPYALTTTNNNSIILDFQIWVWTFGGNLLSPDGEVLIDNDEGRAALGFLVGLMEDNLAAPEIDRPDSRRLTAQNASAFYIDAPVARTMLRQFSGQGEAFDVNVEPMRTPVLHNGDTPQSVAWGHLLLAFADETPSVDDASIEWIDYLLADDVLIAYAIDQSTLPTTRSGLADPSVTGDEFLNAWAATAIAPRLVETTFFDNAADLNQIIGEEVQAALLGQKSVDAAIDDMAARLRDAMS